MSAEEITRNFTEVHLDGLYLSMVALLLFCFAGIALLLALGMIIGNIKQGKKAILITVMAGTMIWIGVVCFEKKEENVEKGLAKIEKEMLVPYVNKLPLVEEDVTEFVVIDKPLETKSFFFPKEKKITQVRITTQNEEGYKVEREMAVEIIKIKDLPDKKLIYKKLKEDVAYYPSGRYDAQLFVPKN